jgi:hypothetical protein
MKTDVLVVSERPELLHHAFETLRPLGISVVGCLGPALGPCKLETSDECPLAAHSNVVIVDSPACGAFTDHLRAIPAADYAADIATKHPDTFPILCGAPEAVGGATGDTAHATNALAVIEMLRQVAQIARMPAHVSDPTSLQGGRE